MTNGAEYTNNKTGKLVRVSYTEGNLVFFRSVKNGATFGATRWATPAKFLETHTAA